jgi:hypothetical protein
VQETILFSLEDKEEVSLKNIKSNAKGLGSRRLLKVLKLENCSRSKE